MHAETNTRLGTGAPESNYLNNTLNQAGYFSAIQHILYLAG
jgi:hypothetical protein